MRGTQTGQKQLGQTISFPKFYAALLCIVGDGCVGTCCDDIRFKKRSEFALGPTKSPGSANDRKTGVITVLAVTDENRITSLEINFNCEGRFPSAENRATIGVNQVDVSEKRKNGVGPGFASEL